MEINLQNSHVEQRTCDDMNVWESLHRGETDFVFQFASPGMRKIIMDTKPTSITALAEINALYRPGPMEAGYVEKYTAIKTGKDPGLDENEKAVSAVLKGVFGSDHPGLLIFQEDIMRICTECAGFTLTEADDIRRAMGKKKLKFLEPYRERFIKNWNIKQLVTIDGLGDFLPEHEFQLTSGGTITALELLKRAGNGESVKIEM